MTEDLAPPRPRFALDEATLRANARLWRLHAGVPVAAVVKSDGYGWGIERMIGALDDHVARFIVADAGEFERARTMTARPIALLADAPPASLSDLLDAGALPNISTSEGLAAVAAWNRERGRAARIRVGLRPAAAWFGFDENGLRVLAPALVASGCEVECWTHLTDPSLVQAQRAAFARSVGALREAGVRVVDVDLTSTASAASLGAAGGAHVRIGVGLFGARYGGPAELRCALRVTGN